MRASLESIFITGGGGRPMQRVAEVEAVAGRGLAGDRYAERTGYWTGTDECQVTLIEGEHLDEIEREAGIRVHGGEHRRNLVMRGVQLSLLANQHFRIGGAVFAYDRPRPPCSYIQSITQPGMTRALGRRGGICARVIVGGTLREGDELVVLDRVDLEALNIA